MIPMALSGLWESLFARNRGKLSRMPWRLFPRIRIAVGNAVPASAAAPDALRTTVAALRGDWR